MDWAERNVGMGVHVQKPSGHSSPSILSLWPLSDGLPVITTGPNPVYLDPLGTPGYISNSEMERRVSL